MVAKNVFITGATSGIGLGIAKTIAKDGHHIGFNGIASQEEVDEVSAELKALGAASCHYFDADMRDAQAARQMINQAISKMDQIDVLINNAGIQHVAPVEDFPMPKWDDVIAINLSACFHTTAMVLDGMRERKFGRIINIASVHGLIASINKTAYIAAKHGVVGLTKAVALETATDGITVNAICPAWVKTPLVEAQIEARAQANGTSFDDETIALVEERQPNKTFVLPEQIGALCLYFMSDAASSVTGIAMPIDGAWTAQ